MKGLNGHNFCLRLSQRLWDRLQVYVQKRKELDAEIHVKPTTVITQALERYLDEGEERLRRRQKI